MTSDAVLPPLPHTRRVKVLQILPELHDRSHDPSDLAEQIVASLPRERFEVTSLFLEGKESPGEWGGMAERMYCFALPQSAFKGLRVALSWRLYCFCRAEGFDVVICNRYKPVSAMLRLNRWLRIPVCIGISHGLGEYKSGWRRFFARLSIDRRWHFVGVSAAVTNYLLEQDCGFTAVNTQTINNAIDVAQTEGELYTRDIARQKLNLPPQSLVIGAIGRLVSVKGHIHLLRAFARVAVMYPNVLLAIIGDGKEEVALRRSIMEFGLKEQILLLGWRDYARRYARAFDLFVMPSLSEGLPRALLEAMCAKLPIIASDIPALRPIVEGAGGQLCPPGDDEIMAERIRCALDLSATERAEKGEATYCYLVTKHTVEAYRQSYRELIEKLLKEIANER